MRTYIAVFTSVSPLLTTFFFFFFNDTATTEIYTLSLHDALPICLVISNMLTCLLPPNTSLRLASALIILRFLRSEEHTSELQSQSNLVCRLLLEKKKKKYSDFHVSIYT